jgi:hypothetical protein
LEAGVRLGEVDASWKPTVAVRPGARIEVQMQVPNESGETIRDLVVGWILPYGANLVPGTTRVANSTWPEGILSKSDNIASGGIEIGSYGANANVYVLAEIEISDSAFPCGSSPLWLDAVAQPKDDFSVRVPVLITVDRRC